MLGVKCSFYADYYCHIFLANLSLVAYNIEGKSPLDFMEIRGILKACTI